MSSLPRYSGRRTIQGGFQSPAAENPPGDISAAEDPSAKCGEGSVASSRHDNLPSSPSLASRNEVWKVEGVSTFSLDVLVRGHGIHIILFTRYSLLHQLTVVYLVYCYMYNYILHGTRVILVITQVMILLFFSVSSVRPHNLYL